MFDKGLAIEVLQQILQATHTILAGELCGRFHRDTCRYGKIRQHLHVAYRCWGKS